MSGRFNIIKQFFKPRGRSVSSTITSFKPKVGKLKKIQEGKKKITDVIDKYASGANPELKKKFRAGSKKGLDKISKIYKGDK